MINSDHFYAESDIATTPRNYTFIIAHKKNAPQISNDLATHEDCLLL
jgi:hypothetical protein